MKKSTLLGTAATLVWWLLGLALAIGFAGLYAADRWYTSPVAGLAEQTLLVPQGATYRDLVSRWHRAEQIETPLLWRLAGRLTGAESKIQAGEYLLPETVTPEQVLLRLSRGEGLVSYKVAFIEGWTLREVRQALSRAPHLKQTLAGTAEVDWLAALNIEAELEAGTQSAEGWFFPDTYAYNRGASDRDILRRAYSRMKRVLADSWATRQQGLALSTPYEALTLASIVEKETGRGVDRATISQVFNLRLQLGMKLQTDPTVIYGIGPEFDGNITRVHLRTDTPFNSYTRLGLPPTPIALPGKESIDAALHPAEGKYLYFVARGDGTSQFSETLSEHNQAVRRYQLLRGN